MHTISAGQVYLAFVIIGALALIDLMLLHKPETVRRAKKVHKWGLFWTGLVMTIIGLGGPLFAFYYFVLGPHWRILRVRKHRGPVGALLHQMSKNLGRRRLCFDCLGAGCTTCGGTGNAPLWDKRV